MLGYVVFNGIFFGIEYLLLRAYSGMFSNFFGIFRTYISKEKEWWKNMRNKVSYK